MLFTIWSLAYLNGGQLIVNINEYNEGLAELVIWTTIAAVQIVGIVYVLEKENSK